MPHLLSGSLAGFVLTAATAAARRGVPAWDAKGFMALNGGADWVQYALWGPMQLGALGAPLVIGGVRFVRGDRSGAVRTVAAGSAAWVGAKVIKNLVGRARPAGYVDETVLRIGAADTGLGYPSGHAAVAVTVATIGLERMPTQPINGVIPVLVGIGRIHVGAHFPLDVIGGWALGALCADAVDGAAKVLATHASAG